MSKVATSPSRLIGRIAFWAIFLAFVSIAASALGIEAVSAFVAAVWGYLSNVKPRLDNCWTDTSRTQV